MTVRIELEQNEMTDNLLTPPIIKFGMLNKVKIILVDLLFNYEKNNWTARNFWSRTKNKLVSILRCHINPLLHASYYSDHDISYGSFSLVSVKHSMNLIILCYNMHSFFFVSFKSSHKKMQYSHIYKMRQIIIMISKMCISIE